MMKELLDVSNYEFWILHEKTFVGNAFSKFAKKYPPPEKKEKEKVYVYRKLHKMQGEIIA